MKSRQAPELHVNREHEMKKPQLAQGTELAQHEPRWPVALTILAVVFLLTVLSARARLFPPWLLYAIAMALLLPMIGVWLSSAREWWLRLEQISTLCLALVVELITLVVLFHVVHEMVLHPTTLSGRQLLASSIAAWVTNVLAFSLVYWRIDRGGPEARVSRMGLRPDWLFPQPPVSGVDSEWQPTFVDYLFLSFSTATAFSTTDTLPLTSRAKLLMMIESTVSLATLVIVASRAINTLTT